LNGSVDGGMEDNGSSSTLMNINTTTAEFDPLSLLTNRDIENFQRKCLQMETTDEGGDEVPDGATTTQSSATCFAEEQRHSLLDRFNLGSEESENALFGKLVASEMDKLPRTSHNLARAQILFLLAQIASSIPINDSQR